METGEKRRLTNPPLRGDRDPAISTDGRNLAFVRYMPSGIADVYVLRLRDGTPVEEPRRVSFAEGRVVPAVGCGRPMERNQIVVDGPAGNFHLSRLTPDGKQRTERMAVGELGQSPVVSARGGRLAYSKVIRDANIWRVDVSDLPTGLARPNEFISSSRLILIRSTPRTATASCSRPTAPGVSRSGQPIVKAPVSCRSPPSEVRRWAVRVGRRISSKSSSIAI